MTTTDTRDAGVGAASIPLRLIRRDRNIRTTLDLDDDFVASIAAQGILVRCVVEPLDDDPDRFEYVAIAGHRRMAALEQTHGDDAVVPCEVQISDGDAERALFMLIENLQRHDLDPVDEARGYARVLDAGWTQDELADSVGRPVKRVRERLTLLALDTDELDRVRARQVTLDDAVELAKLDDRELRDRVIAQKNGYESLAQTAKKARRQLELEAKRDTKLAELDRLGVACGKQPPRTKAGGQTPQRVAASTGYMYGALTFDDANAARRHRGEPCHYVQLEIRHWSEQIDTIDWCTDPGRHAKKGDSALKATKAPANGNGHAAPKESAAARERREAREQAWSDFVRSIGSGGMVSTDQRDAVLRAALADLVIHADQVDVVDEVLIADEKIRRQRYGPAHSKAAEAAIAELGAGQLVRLLAAQLLGMGMTEPQERTALALAAAFGWELDDKQQKLVNARPVESTADVATLDDSATEFDEVER